MGFSKRDDRSCCSDDSGSDVFRCVPRNRTAFFTWKIEGLRAISVPRNKIGYFYSESAYIIYTVSSKECLPYPGIPSKDIKGNNSVRAIHFWIGSSCDSTVSGAAALRAAELDSQVCASLLFRESEGRESSRFLSYFRQELIIERIHNDQPVVTLHRVTGLSIPILTELEQVCWDNFSSNDVMLLIIQSQGVIFVWIGSGSSALHKRHALRILEEQKDSNDNIKIVIVDDGYEQTLSLNDKNLFDKFLDPNERSVLPQPPRKIYQPSPIKLYKCSEQSGKYKVAELKSGPIFRNDLISNSVFLIDRGEAGVWAWVGREVDAREKLEAVRNARGFVKKKNYSSSVPVARAIENEEPIELKTLIKSWEPAKIRPLTLPPSFEPEYMNERPKMAAECQLVDDGSGKKILWRVSIKDGIIEVNEMSHMNGIYFAGCCYIMKYIYGTGRREKIIVYCWEGAHSSSVDRKTALEAACRIAEDTNGQLVKVSQGFEPPHLLQIYGGKLRILAGQHQETAPKKYLVRVFGSTPYTSKAVERPLRPSSLDSGGVFILYSNSPVVWCGERSTGDAREASRRLAPSTAPLICEGKEDDEFWHQLGGKGHYDSETNEIGIDMDKHLYECKIIDGIFIGDEVLGFTQNSLLPEAAWLLVTGSVIWVWLGNYSQSKSIERCVENAATFLYTHPAGRDRNTIISIIKQGYEPSTFIGLFENWNHNHLRDYTPFEQSKMSLQGKEPVTTYITTDKLSSDFDGFVKYPLRILRNEPEHLPTGIDVFKKEMHLTYDDFISIFKMNPSEFDKLPAWRRQRLKQAAGLF
ncbi:villin-like protein quail isoform X2 [Aphidius gifuensis]|uniref:villin-like protein quail isoform X2 n=1 Tax=Aphidius gifuensis TaxID=684658 RepID=UPI001CDCD776|nr:villin-like protein quail isoform X2 [Aphidius gifuensis]